MLGREDVSLFCVFDGTVGDHAAAFCHDKFPGILVKRPSFAAAVEAMDGGDVAATKTKLAAALQEVRPRRAQRPVSCASVLAEPRTGPMAPAIAWRQHLLSCLATWRRRSRKRMPS